MPQVKAQNEITIAGMLTINNDQEWFKDSLITLEKVTNKIIILDKREQNQKEQLEQLSAKPIIYLHAPNCQDHLTAKNQLLQRTLKDNPDWIIDLNGNEVLEKQAPAIIFEELQKLDREKPFYTAFLLNILFFWNSKKQYRCDPSLFGNFWTPKIFSTWGQCTSHLEYLINSFNQVWPENYLPNNHVGRQKPIDVKIKYFGYLKEKTRTKAFQQFEEKLEININSFLEGEIHLAHWQERTTHRQNLLFPSTFTEEYFELEQELINEIPLAAEKILEISCGMGYLGQILKQRNAKCTIFGIEEDELAYHAAKLKTDYCINATPSIESLKRLGATYETANNFDVIVIRSQTEPLIEQPDFLVQLKNHLQPDGKLLLSIANPYSLANVLNLLKDNPSRNLAHSKLNINDVTKLLSTLGFKVTKLTHLMDSDYQAEIPDIVVPFDVNSDLITLKNITSQKFKDLLTKKYLLTMKKDVDPQNSRLISIIIPTLNQLPYTKLCLESLYTHASLPYELIIVDNGSTDGTQEFLASLPNAKVICNEQNLGFAAACNQGLKAAKGKYLVLLNNDTIVTANWLGKMTRWLDKDPTIGIVGPMSNYAAGDQYIWQSAYLNDINNPTLLTDIETFNTHWTLANQDKAFETHSLVGFCFVLRRELLDTVGYFDTRFGLGNYEDNDFCLRTLLADYKLWLARDVYIHHFGSKTFEGEKIDYLDYLEKAWQKFKIKWGLPQDLSSAKGYHAYDLIFKRRATAKGKNHV